MNTAKRSRWPLPGTGEPRSPAPTSSSSSMSTASRRPVSSPIISISVHGITASCAGQSAICHRSTPARTSTATVTFGPTIYGPCRPTSRGDRTLTTPHAAPTASSCSGRCRSPWIGPHGAASVVSMSRSTAMEEKTPTSPGPPEIATSGCISAGAPRRSTSTTPSAHHPPNTSTTSFATPPRSTESGVNGRWWDGSPPLPRSD